MSNFHFSVISIANNGTQVAASGYTTGKQVWAHIADHLQCELYVEFFVISTNATGPYPSTDIQRLSRRAAEANEGVQEAREKRYGIPVAGKGLQNF